MTHVASPASIGAAISPVYAPWSSWWTVWAPTATVGSASPSASRTAARQTNGGQMTRVTPGTRVRSAMVRASSPASAGVVCIFQLAATMTSRMAGIMTERQAPGGFPRAAPSAAACYSGADGAADPLVVVEREPLDAFERPLDRRPMERQAGPRARTGSLRASRVARRRRGGRPAAGGRAGRRHRGSRSHRAGVRRR